MAKPTKTKQKALSSDERCALYRDWLYQPFPWELAEKYGLETSVVEQVIEEEGERQRGWLEDLASAERRKARCEARLRDMHHRRSLFEGILEPRDPKQYATENQRELERHHGKFLEMEDRLERTIDQAIRLAAELRGKLAGPADARAIVLYTGKGVRDAAED